MKHHILTLLVGWLSVAAPAWAMNEDELLQVDLPVPLRHDAELFERYWIWLKAEVGAPEELFPPPIEVAPLQRSVRMAFAYPTEARPYETVRIIMSPRSIDRAAGDERLIVLGELAHELVHYVLVLRENDWADEPYVYDEAAHHHCDAEFQRLNRGISDILWQAYHSPDTTRAIDQMIRLACWRDGHDLGAKQILQ